MQNAGLIELPKIELSKEEKKTAKKTSKKQLQKRNSNEI